MLSAVVVVAAFLSGAAAGGASPVRISGVHFDGYLPGSPEPDSAIRLKNTDPKRPAAIGGFLLTESFSPRKKKTASMTPTSSNEAFGRTTRKNDGGLEGLRFPQGTVLPPGGELWAAATAWGFVRVWGHPPAFEAAPTAPEVPDLEGPGTFLKLPGSRGTVALVDDGGSVIDFVAYETTKEPAYSEDDFSGLPWKGGPIRLANTSFYGWTGQVLARDMDEAGELLAETDSAADWDSGFSFKQLGDEPTHRIERAGQTRFLSKRVSGKARVLATSAPDNNHKALLDAFAAAKSSIRVRIYELTNPKIIEGLMKAKARGVDVTLYLEGAPVAGIADIERMLLDRASKAGIPVYFIGGTAKNPVKPRYRFDHSKYVILDDKKVVIGTENYGRSGVPAINSWGNRGWMVHIESKEFVEQLRAVWDADLGLDVDGKKSVLGDIVDINDSATDAYGLPYRDPSFVANDTIPRGRYDAPEKPVLVDEIMDLELVLSPDTSLNESSSVLGLIGRAKSTLFIEQNSVRRRWGKKGDDKETEGAVPNLALQAVIAAARRGVQTRVLLDSTWYNVQGDEDRDNDDTALFLNGLAQKEGLDLVAKVINLETTALEKIHAKGIISDSKEVFVGSINWTENSFKGNREVGVIVSNDKIAGYYAKLFRRDWSKSRVFQAPVSAVKTEAFATTDDNSPVVLRLGRDEKLFVVGEHHRRDRTWLEIRLPRGEDTAFVDATDVGVPLASPGEALHVIGKEAVIEGVVVATNVSERRIQLRFADEQRPPFTAVIFTKDADKFLATGLNPASAYQGRMVRVRGTVKIFHGPEIIIGDPRQISIIK